VQLFDDEESRADAVTDFVLAGEARGERILLALTPDHWQLVAGRIGRTSYPLAARLEDGRLRVLDATATLRRILRSDRPDPARFDEIVGNPVRRLVLDDGPHAGLRIYGEIVDLFAAVGDFQSAAALEQLWNGVLHDHRFTLMCGYLSSPTDLLSDWLLRDLRERPAPKAQA
jgi:hypothetical protein